MQATKQATKAQATKQASKAKPQATKAQSAPAAAGAKSASAPAKLPFFAALYAAIIADKFGAAVTAYYRRAAEYHKAQKTVFPRSRNNELRSELFGASVGEAKRKANAEAIIGRCAAGTLAAGAKDGQALYDQMRFEADTANIVWPLTK